MIEEREGTRREESVMAERPPVDVEERPFLSRAEQFFYLGRRLKEIKADLSEDLRDLRERRRDLEQRLESVRTRLDQKIEQNRVDLEGESGRGPEGVEG